MNFIVWRKYTLSKYEDTFSQKYFTEPVCSALINVSLFYWLWNWNLTPVASWHFQAPSLENDLSKGSGIPRLIAWLLGCVCPIDVKSTFPLR